MINSKKSYYEFLFQDSLNYQIISGKLARLFHLSLDKGT